jgi:hypothetical protein
MTKYILPHLEKNRDHEKKNNKIDIFIHVNCINVSASEILFLSKSTSTGDLLLLSVKQTAPYAASCLIHFSVLSLVVSFTAR